MTQPLDECRIEFERWWFETFKYKPPVALNTVVHEGMDYGNNLAQYAWLGFKGAYNLRNPKPASEGDVLAEKLAVWFYNVNWIDVTPEMIRAFDNVVFHLQPYLAAMPQPAGNGEVKTHVLYDFNDKSHEVIMLKDAQELHAKLDIAREGLSFYAQGDYTMKYAAQSWDPVAAITGNIYKDHGTKAQQTLKLLEK